MIEIVRNEEYESQAIEIINFAKHSIFFSTFKAHLNKKGRKGDCNLLLATLLKKVQEGIEVRTMLQCGYDRTSLSRMNRIVAKQLIEAGAKVKYLEGRRIVHAKIILVDDLYVLAGSHNWSISSLRKNFEISFYFWGIEEVAPVATFTEEEWERGKEFKE